MDKGDLENLRQGNMTEEQFIKIRNIKGAVSLGRNLIAVAAILYILFAAGFRDKMKAVDDPVMKIFANGFQILLIVLLVIAALAAIRDLLLVILCFSGKADNGFGLRYVKAAEAMGTAAGNVFQIVMGVVFVIISCFTIKNGPSMLAEGSSVEALYVVSGIFIASGAGLVIAGIIGIIKAIRAAVAGFPEA